MLREQNGETETSKIYFVGINILLSATDRSDPKIIIIIIIVMFMK